jgi:hypothetical protein
MQPTQLSMHPHHTHLMNVSNSLLLVSYFQIKSRKKVVSKCLGLSQKNTESPMFLALHAVHVNHDMINKNKNTKHCQLAKKKANHINCWAITF